MTQNEAIYLSASVICRVVILKRIWLVVVSKLVSVNGLLNLNHLHLSRAPHAFRSFAFWGFKLFSYSTYGFSQSLLPRLHLHRSSCDVSVCDILDIVGDHGLRRSCLQFIRASYDFLFWLSSMF